MTTQLRRWTGRSGQPSSAEGDGSPINQNTAMAFATEAGNTFLRWANTGGISPFMLWELPSARWLQFSADIRINVAPSAAQLVMQARNTAGTAALGNFAFGPMNGGANANMHLRSGGDTSILNPTVNLGVWYRIFWVSEVGTSTSNGRTKARIVRLSDDVLIGENEVTGRNNGTTNGYRFHFGKLGTASTLDIDLDNLFIGNESYDFLETPSELDPRVAVIDLAIAPTAIASEREIATAPTNLLVEPTAQAIAHELREAPLLLAVELTATTVAHEVRTAPQDLSVTATATAVGREVRTGTVGLSVSPTATTVAHEVRTGAIDLAIQPSAQSGTTNVRSANTDLTITATATAVAHEIRSAVVKLTIAPTATKIQREIRTAMLYLSVQDTATSYAREIRSGRIDLALTSTAFAYAREQRAATLELEVRPTALSIQRQVRLAPLELQVAAIATLSSQHSGRLFQVKQPNGSYKNYRLKANA